MTLLIFLNMYHRHVLLPCKDRKLYILIEYHLTFLEKAETTRVQAMVPFYIIQGQLTLKFYLQCSSLFFSADAYCHFDLPSAQPLLTKLGKILFFVLPVSCCSCTACLVCSCFSFLIIASVSFSLNDFMPWMHISLWLHYTRVYLRILYCELPESCSSVRFTLFSGRVFLSVSCSLHFVSLAVEFNRVTKFKSSMVWRSLSYSSWQIPYCTVVFLWRVLLLCFCPILDNHFFECWIFACDYVINSFDFFCNCMIHSCNLSSNVISSAVVILLLFRLIVCSLRYCIYLNGFTWIACHCRQSVDDICIRLCHK